MTEYLVSKTNGFLAVSCPYTTDVVDGNLSMITAQDSTSFYLSKTFFLLKTSVLRLSLAQYEVFYDWVFLSLSVMVTDIFNFPATMLSLRCRFTPEEFIYYNKFMP